MCILFGGLDCGSAGVLVGFRALARPGGDLLSHVLLTQYHRRGWFSRPSSGWVRVFHHRYGHQVVSAPGFALWLCVFACGLAGFGFCVRCVAVCCGVFAAVREAFADQADRAIRTGQLHALLRFHVRPIDVVVYHGSIGETLF